MKRGERGSVSPFCFAASFLKIGAVIKTALFFVAAAFLTTCGLEDYPYINPVYQSDITPQGNNHATVNLRGYTSTLSFSNFVVFYRIYVSDTEILNAPTRDQHSVINTALASDYNTIHPYIDSDTLVNSNMDTLFRQRGYYYLYAEEGGATVTIESLLDSSVTGTSLEFDFGSGKPPTMSFGSSEYNLRRSTGGGSFTPVPTDRYLVNRSELWDPDNINTNTNADVVNKANMSGAGPYTYAALFIAAAGMDSNTLSYIYSTPALINIFRLPDQWQ